MYKVYYMLYSAIATAILDVFSESANHKSGVVVKHVFDSTDNLNISGTEVAIVISSNMYSKTTPTKQLNTLIDVYLDVYSHSSNSVLTVTYELFNIFDVFDVTYYFDDGETKKHKASGTHKKVRTLGDVMPRRLFSFKINFLTNIDTEVVLMGSINPDLEDIKE